MQVRAEFDRVYAAATQQWQLMVQEGRTGRGKLSAQGVAEIFMQDLPVGCPHKFSGRSLINAVKEGRVGEARGRPGPKAAIPAEFIQSIAEFSQMKQVAGDEQKPRQLVQVAIASCKGTAYEGHVQTQRLSAQMYFVVCAENSAWGFLLPRSSTIAGGTGSLQRI